MNKKMASAKRFFRAMISRRVVILGIIGTSFFALVAIFAPLIATHDITAMDPTQVMVGISREHLLGTDMYGRDIFSRIVYGARVSLLTGVISVLIAALIGTFLGMVCSYYGGLVDRLIMGACEVWNSIPQVIISMTLVTMFGGGIVKLAWILCLSCIPGIIRMMRASSLSLMTSDYVLAARLSGQSKLKIMYKHILPNSISPIIVSATSQIGTTILMESGLSFLGVGIKVPTPSWGTILSEARPYLMLKPLYVLAPCVCIALLIIRLNLLGDGVRDARDPSLKGEN